MKLPYPGMSYDDARQWRPGLWGPPGLDLMSYYQVMADRLPVDAQCVELGVCYGRSLLFLAAELYGRKKHLARVWGVDTWGDPPATQAGGGPSVSFRECLQALLIHAQYGELDMVHLVRADSGQAARLMDAASLDLVFIDADHTYEAVRRDIHAWVTRIKPGGTLAGHDYGEHCPGVIQAVDEAFGDRVEHLDTVWVVDIP
jgi:Methyltransferase domain